MRSTADLGAWTANNIFVSFCRRKRTDEFQISECLTLLRALLIHIEAQIKWSNIGLESYPVATISPHTMLRTWTWQCLPSFQLLHPLTR